MISTADSLLGEIESYCRRSGIAESTFGKLAVNDGKLCVRLRNGKDVTLETAAKIRDFISGQESCREPGAAYGAGSPRAEDAGAKNESTNGTTMSSKSSTSKT